MPAAGRLGDIGSGHGCFPPSPASQGSEDVFTNARPALRKTDMVIPHDCGQCSSHGRDVSAGSATVNINGKPAARVGDAISCGGAVSTGSGDVIIGDDTWAAGSSTATASVRFVLSQVPGSTEHGYYKENYELYHNDSLVQRGKTDAFGMIEFEPDVLTGEFMIKALGRKWRLDVRALAPADTEAGVKDRLSALGFTCSDKANETAKTSLRNAATGGLGWFQVSRNEIEAVTPTNRIKDLLKAILP